MNEQRIFNFSAGPSQLPLAVLKKAQEQMLNYENSGMSVMEMSHRSTAYDKIIKNAQACLRRLMNIPNNYQVLFLQGGATMQFSAIPLNLMKNKKADYIITGYFAEKAYEEATKFLDAKIVASSKDSDFTYIPKQEQLCIREDSDYVYFCANNTIYGSEWHYLPDTKKVDLVCDMSSNILSKEIDVSKFGLIFAGAQKNMGCAGLTVVIVREDLIGHYPKNAPILLDYALMAKKDSMYNTPPTYAIYILGLVLEWIEEQGGISVIQKQNVAKAKLLYDYLDQSKFYKTKVAKEDRSIMNVTFTTGSKVLDAEFVKASIDAGMSNLKGHRAVGGMRASIYNAMPLEGVEKLVAFMKDFENQYQ